MGMLTGKCAHGQQREGQTLARSQQECMWAGGNVARGAEDRGGRLLGFLPPSPGLLGPAESHGTADRQVEAPAMASPVGRSVEQIARQLVEDLPSSPGGGG